MDPFPGNLPDSPMQQGRKLVLVTPDNATDLPDFPKALLIGGTAGNISIDPIDGGLTAAIVPVTAGQTFDAVRVRRVRATGTTATPIWAIY
jgi:hypothetical protein